jgi:LacI family transcriptional regulator
MTKKIGIITNDGTPIFQRDVIAGVEDYAGQSGFSVLVDEIGKTKQTSLPMDAIDGVLVIANVLSNSELQSLYQTGKPLTLVSHLVEHIPIPAIIQNNIDGISQLVDYLVLACGRRELVFIQGDMQQHDGIERDRIFQQSMMRHDLLVPATHILHGNFEVEVAQKSMTDFVQQGYAFDAVIAADFLMGIAALDVLTANGFAVPEKVCVVGFGDGTEAMEAGLTTIGADVVEMGRRAARQLLAQIEGRQFTGVTWLNTELVERSSCQRVNNQ